MRPRLSVPALGLLPWAASWVLAQAPPVERPQVTAPGGRVLIAALGDSITAGVGAPAPYATRLQEVLGPGYAVSNFGLPGDTADGMLGRWRSEIKGRGVQWLVLLGGIDEISQGASAATIWSSLRTTLDEARADGLGVVVMTLTPFKNNRQWTASKQTQLESLNALIRASGGGVSVADVYPEFGDVDGRALKASYDSGDGVHTNQEGTDRIADLVRTVLARSGAGFLGPTGTGEPPVIDVMHTKRPGRFPVGPFYVTPTVHLGTIGLDTNVFYSPTDRRSDLTTSGGPGLDVVLPLGPSVRVSIGGDANYVYFVRTVSQRRFVGDGLARVEWRSALFQASVVETYTKTFSRPNFEVDRRIVQDNWSTKANLLKTVGRAGLRAEAETVQNKVPPGELFFGTDLGTTLTYDEKRALLGLRLGLTAKTAFVVEGDYQVDTFALNKARDADSDRLYAGFRIDSQDLLYGSAVAGVRLFRPRVHPGVEVRKPYAAVDLSYRFGPRTLFNAVYNRDLIFSAFNTSGLTPTMETQLYGARLEQKLFGQVDIRLFARVTTFVTDGTITVLGPGGSTTVAIRDDTAREYGADLGYTFRSSLRIGIAAAYVRRLSRFADFGINGLLVGGTVNYDPKARR